MNAIYKHPGEDKFTFLENVPEKPYKYPNDTYNESPKHVQKAIDKYQIALAECIEKRMVIGNPEMIKTVQFHIHHEVGKVYEWPWTYRIDFMNSNDYLAGAQNKVVILCPEPVNSSMSEKEERIYDCIHCDGTGKRNKSALVQVEPVVSQDQEEQRKFAACIGMVFLSNEGESEKAIDLVVKQFLLTRKPID